MNTLLQIVALAIGLAWSGGCQRPAVELTPITSSRFELIEQIPATEPLRVDALFGNAPTTLQLDVIGADGRVVSASTMVRSETSQYNATFVDTEDQQSFVYWTIDAQGNAVMTAHVDMNDRAVSVFTPPLIVGFRELPPGELRRSEAAMRVVDLNNPRRIKEMGTAMRTMSYVGDERVRTPLGEFVAKRIDIHFIATMRMATAEEKRTFHVVPEIGIVADTARIDVTVLGALTTSTTRQVVLREHPQDKPTE